MLPSNAAVRTFLPMPNGIVIGSLAVLSVSAANTASQYATDSFQTLTIDGFVASDSNAASACGDFSPFAAAQNS